MNPRLIPLIAITGLFLSASKLGAQTAESKLGALNEWFQSFQWLQTFHLL